MRSARPQKGILGKAARWLFVIGLLLSFSTFQAAWASTACRCQTLGQSEACEYAHGCDSSDGMYDETSQRSEWAISETKYPPSGRSDSPTVTCCQPQQQGERPLVTLANQLPVDVGSSQAVFVPVLSATVDVTRTHDPPRSRPLYIRHSCLLI
jgi:hypothetical protein